MEFQGQSFPFYTLWKWKWKESEIFGIFLNKIYTTALIPFLTINSSVLITGCLKILYPLSFLFCITVYESESWDLYQVGKNPFDFFLQKMSNAISFSLVFQHDMQFLNTPGTRGWSRLRDRTLAVPKACVKISFFS